MNLLSAGQKQLPEGAVPALEKELITRLQNQYENCNLTIRRGSQDGLSIVGAADGDKNVYRAFCRKRGKALTTGLLTLRLMLARIFRIPQFAYPFDAAADNF